MDDQDENYVEYLKSLSPKLRENALDGKIADAKHEIEETDEFSSQAAITNAQPFDVEDYDVEWEDLEFTEDTARVPVSYQASGEQDTDKPWCGSSISGSAVAVIDRDGKVSFEDVTAEVDMDGEDE